MTISCVFKRTPDSCDNEKRANKIWDEKERWMAHVVGDCCIACCYRMRRGSASSEHAPAAAVFSLLTAAEHKRSRNIIGAVRHGKALRRSADDRCHSNSASRKRRPAAICWSFYRTLEYVSVGLSESDRCLRQFLPRNGRRLLSHSHNSRLLPAVHELERMLLRRLYAVSTARTCRLYIMWATATDTWRMMVAMTASCLRWKKHRRTDFR